jgi:steroid delta-isomerase-like uncharacterized protein
MIEEVWNKGNFAIFDELVDPSFKSEDPVLGTVDKAGYLETVKAYRAAFPDLKLEIVSQVCEEDRIATRWIARGTNKGAFLGMAPSGKFATTTGLDLAEFRDGKLVSEFNVYDSLSLLRQLGLESVAVPTPELHQKPEVEHRA